MDSKLLKILVIEPFQKPYIKEIPDTLENLQEVVGGCIEEVYLPGENRVVIICNEEGKLLGLPLNRTLRNEENEVVDAIAGTFFLTGINEDNFDSLTDEEVEKYSKIYKNAEIIGIRDHQIISVEIPVIT